VTCATCGATIADKAIVCYRCGTATAIPDSVRRPAPPTPRSIAPALVLLAVELIALGIGIWLVIEAEPGSPARLAGFGLVGAGALAGALGAFRLARRR
jgi:hypothetical protein